MTEITLAHDYFLQSGGAERVAASWMDHYRSSPMYTMAIHRESTFDSIDYKRIKAKLEGQFWANHLHKLLPILPQVAKSVTVDQGDVALVSTSGWAHMYKFDVPTVAYVHSPARWLYAKKDYKLGLPRYQTWGLNATSRLLIHNDKPAMARMCRVVSNSKVTRDRVWDAYRIDSEIISPPVTEITAVAQKPAKPIPEKYILIVARNRGYKRLENAAQVAKLVGLPLVIIGTGTEVLEDIKANVWGLGRVTDGELKFLYKNASLLLATAYEDFGLTVLEANAEGTPVVAIPAGGYLETVRSGVNGALAAGPHIEDFIPAIHEALSVSALSCKAWAEGFSLANHTAHLERVIDDAKN